MSAEINMMKTIFSINSSSFCVCFPSRFRVKLQETTAKPCWCFVEGKIKLVTSLQLLTQTSVKNHETSLLTHVKLSWWTSVSVVTVPKLLCVPYDPPSLVSHFSALVSDCPILFLFFLQSHMLHDMTHYCGKMLHMYCRLEIIKWNTACRPSNDYCDFKVSYTLIKWFKHKR